MRNAPRLRKVALPFSQVDIVSCAVDALYTWEHRDLAGPFWRLYYHDRPGAFVIWRGKTLQLPAIRPIVIPPYTAFDSGVARDGEAVVTQVFVHFLMPRLHWWVAPGVYVLDASRQIDRVARRIVKNSADREARPDEAFEIVGAVLGCVSMLPASAWERRALDPRIERAVELIASDFASDVDNDTLAEAVQMSTRSFTRVFARQTGTSPHRYVMKVRLDHAAVLLQHSDRSIESIAYECSFNERSYFTRAFAKQWGVPPAAFRRAARRTEMPSVSSPPTARTRR
jgi:AraC-like DNA-binding protein